MVYGKYVKQFLNKYGSTGARVGLGAATAYAGRRGSNTDSTTSITVRNKRKRKRVVRRVPRRGTLVKRPAKRVKAINSNLPKGVGKKFLKKVQKSVNFTANWGLYISTSAQQLRQQTRDFRSLYYTDENGSVFLYASPYDLMHMASVLFNQKTDTSSWTTTTGNFDDRIKINVISYVVNFYFRSTSSHVVNIEVFECTARDDLTSTGIHAANYVANSYNDMQNNYARTGAVTAAAAATDLNATQQEWVELHNNFTVRRRVYKLQPGDYAKHTMKIMGNRVVDFSKCSENGTILWMAKGMSKQVFFRVLNDPTVSTTTNATPTAGADVGQIHHWPSNVIGGVAMTVTKHFKMAALPNPQASNANHAMANSIKRSQWLKTITDAKDQQVAYNNPVVGATVDT